MRLTIIFITFFSFGSFAQDSTLIHLLNHMDSRLEKKQKDLVWKNNRTWALKFSPLHMAVGDIGFYFERRTGQRTSIEVGVGATISNVGESGFLPDIDFPLLDYDILYISNASYSKTGFLGALEFRVYPIEHARAMNHFYIAPAVKYKLYNFGIRDYNNNLPNTNGTDMRFNGYLNCGFQLWPAKRFALDAFFGAGLGYRVETSSNVQSYYENGEWKHYWQPDEENEIHFLMNVGVKLGIGGGK